VSSIDDEITGSLPLDEREEALWMLQRVFPGDGISNQGIAVYFSGRTDLGFLQRSVLWVVQRHPMLRSAVVMRNGRPCRVFWRRDEMSASVSVRRTERATLNADMLALARHAFDIERDELARFTLLELPDGAQVLLAVIHHLAFDALSTPKFLNDLATAYRSFETTGAPPAAGPEPAVSRPSEPSAESIRYWSERLGSLRPDSMLLHAANYSDTSAGFTGGRYGRPMSGSASEAVHSLRKRMHASDNIVLLAAYLLLLLRHGAGPDLVVGVPVSLRSEDDSGAIGNYFSTVPLVVQANACDSFADLVARTFERFIEALEHRDLSYEAMIRRFQRVHYDWQTPVFRHMFNFWPTAAEGRADDGWIEEAQQIDSGYSRYDLEFVLSPSGQGYDLQIAYRRELHDEGFVRRLFDKYEALLISAARDAEGEVGRLPMATDHDKVVELANRTAVRWRGPKTVNGMVDTQIRTRPGHTAIISPGGTVSYEQLGRLSRIVSSRLSASGVISGDLVAVAAGRGAGSAAAIVGAWRLGAAYLPLDPAQPLERLRFELRDAGVAALIGDAGTARRLAGSAKVVIEAEEILSAGLAPGGPKEARRHAWEREPDPASTAYVIYTSGSTGRPKGVQVTHANLTNVICHFARALGCDEHTNMLWLTTIGFDISALELLLPLSFGGKAVVADDNAQTRPDMLLKAINEFDVNVIQATPTTWRMISALDHVDLTGRWLLCGGEPLSSALAGQLLASGGRLVNVYGPTETTIWSTAGPVIEQVPGRNPAVGRPIANTAIAVVDEFGADCPIDVVGEVVIGGAGVAAGYLRRADLTATRFIRHDRIGRAYRTGDLGRWCADGRLALHGRADRQVKIHGGRIELDEVELVLEAHPGVDAAAVVVDHPGQAGEALAAFVVPSADVTAEELWSLAAQQLPSYAVPSAISLLPALPVNPSGKTDYAQLAQLASARQQPAVSAGQSGTTDDITAWLTGLWRDLLRDPGIDASSNFFLSGGQSLLAISVTERIRECYGVDLPPLAIFKNPTPRGLAETVKAQGLPVSPSKRGD
jgi:amino acid adenylation domain-containing protein